MKPRVDVYFSMQSNYCYLLLDRLIWLADRVDLHIRPVLPGLIRNPGAYTDRTATEAAYFDIDTARLARMLNISYGSPDPSPVAFREGSLWHAAREQPRVGPLYQLFGAATLQGKGLAFLDAVMRLIWNGKGADWTDPEVMSDALAAVGLSHDALLAEDPARVDDLLAANEADMLRHHHGVPLMVVNDEPFYGQDRFDHLCWRLGLEEGSR